MSRGEELLERIAKAVEALAIDPEIEIKAGPPVCPSCGTFNPTVVLPFQEGGTGPMSELVVNGTCKNCGNRFFIVIESYSVHKTLENAGIEIKERERAGFFQQ